MQVLSVNTGRVRPLQIQGRRFMSAIGKTPVEGAVPVARMGLAGDEQADLSVHGGLAKAVYAWPAEHYPWWQQQRLQAGASLFDEPLPAGFAGENLTLTGLLEPQVWVGDELVFDDCVLRVTAPREPCFKFNAVMGFAQAARLMAQSGRCGFYLSVVREGTITAGQCFELRPGQRGLGIVEALAAKLARHRN